MELSRRNFLIGTSLFLAAPAIIRVADLMPIRAWTDELHLLVPGEHIADWVSLKEHLRSGRMEATYKFKNPDTIEYIKHLHLHPEIDYYFVKVAL